MQQAIRARERDSLAATSSVLLVDDDPDDRLLISDLLESTPTIGTVEAVASFAEARAAIFERRHDVYLVDYRLGAHNGLELIAEAADRASGPFIILTGLSDPEVDRRAAEVGAYDFLDKHGLDVEGLARAIRYSTTLWRANHQLTRRSERQTALASLSRHAVDVADLASFLPYALDAVLETLDADCGAIVAFHREGSAPVVSTGPCGRASALDTANDIEVHSSVSKVIADGRPWGRLDVHSHGAETLDPDDVTFVEAVTNLIAAVVDRTEAGERIVFQASLLDQVHDAVVATDLQGHVTYWNRSAQEMLGWTASEALGESVFALVTPEPDQAPEVAATVARSLAETGIWQGEAILKRKNGSAFVAWMSDSLLRDDSGSPVGVVGIKADVTRLRQMESEARRNETVAASVLRSVHFPVAVLDPQGRVVAVNRAWTQFAIDNDGDPETTGVGANYLDVCRVAGNDPGAKEALVGIRSVLEGRSTSFSLEYECSAPGDERWFEMGVQPVPGEGAVVVHWNVTAERLHRMALQDTIEAKDRFIASISHELRTPLTAVVGLAEELREGHIGPDEAHEFQTLIADQARELSLLVDDLLIAARLDSDTLTFRPGVVDVGQEIDHVLAPWMSETVREIRLSIDPGAAAWADASRVRQILRNLISNAIRYGADPIDVHVTADESQVTIAVADHGPGIPESARERMFQPYSTFAPTEGLTASVGLGLHVSRDLASRMGGALDYRRAGGVTIFELMLPAASIPVLQREPRYS